VHLSRAADNGEYVVVKEVPTLDMVMGRLRGKWPQLPDEVIEKRARKFSDKIFPIFLTREAAILKIVNRDLPEEYRQRIPKLLELERDDRGYARRLTLSWLRNGGQPLSQIEFARQSADLLRVLHDLVGVMHLDLRLDNFVITPQGVGFVDFGSAVRADENLKQSPLLSNLFEELMRTSEIQRMLLSMTRTGQVTSQAISSGLHKVDKAVDYFYLAVQINSPHSNPDLKDLIRYDKDSAEAKLLTKLTEQILRPSDPANPPFRSAADILGGIEKVERALQDEQSGAA
jgi:serine/threonine protein kinase